MVFPPFYSIIVSDTEDIHHEDPDFVLELQGSLNALHFNLIPQPKPIDSPLVFLTEDQQEELYDLANEAMSPYLYQVNTPNIRRELLDILRSLIQNYMLRNNIDIKIM